jgi:hypothetical protein
MVLASREINRRKTAMIPNNLSWKGPICSHLLISALFPGALEFKLLFIRFCGFSLLKDLLFCISWEKKSKNFRGIFGDFIIRK